MKKTVAILAGGGPAPGINTVFASIGKAFLRDGYKVIGIHEGYRGLFNPERETEVMDFKLCDRIVNRGGSYFMMSRYKPKDSDFSKDFFVENNVGLLVTIGGDDTASTANRIAKFLHEQNVDIQNIHVPKTIDNDLPLPEGIPTFGYESARESGVGIATAVYEDARTSGNWFVVCGMGRSAGHLAFGIGTAAHYPMIIIPEMFDKTEMSFDKITKLMVSSIIKRKIRNIPYGGIMISEGMFHFLPEEEIANSGINFTYDEHGHPELGNVSKAHVFNELLQRKLKELGIKVKSRPVELGYEIRCTLPSAYDLEYCTALGLGTKKLYDEGKTACMVSVDSHGDVNPLYLKDLENEQGKIPPRLVNMNSKKVHLFLHNNMDFIHEKDYEAAKAYLDHPEEYDFYKILHWE